MSKRINPRRRSIFRIVGGGTVFVLVAVGLVLWSRPEAEPYIPGAPVEGITNALDRELPEDYPRVSFTDVTAEAGIDFHHFDGQRSTQLPEDMGSGAAWGDYDGDGWLDLYVVNFAGALSRSPEEIAASPASDRLYRNLGNGAFADVTEAAGLAQRAFGMAAAWADYDGDGRLDLSTSSYGRHRLFRNNGDGRFEDVSEAAGLLTDESFWTGLSWSDFDRDGDLDLYVCGYVQYRYDPEDADRTSQQFGADTPTTLNPSSYAPERNLLYRNRGDGTFEEVAQAMGLDNAAGRSLSATWGDFDDDGWPDLYVANDVSDNVLFHNTGRDIFEDVSHPAWVADYRGAMGLASGDWDNDRDLDLFVTHWIAQENALYVNLGEAAPVGAAPGKRPALRFNDRADMHGLGEIALDYVGWGTSFFDYDLDGRLDLLVVNGSTLQGRVDPKELVPMTDQLFWNAGERGFFDVSRVSAPALAQARVSRGAAVADYDKDGDVDIFVVDFNGPARLLRNEGGGGNWLKVRLRGAGANRQALGARVEIVAGGTPQVREIGSGSSYLSQDATEAIFGLGAATEVERLDVRWPDGSWQALGPKAANMIVEIGQGEGGGGVMEGAANAGDDTGEATEQTADVAGKTDPSEDAEAAGGDDTANEPSLSREDTLAFWEHYRAAVATMRIDGDWAKAAEGFRTALALNPRHEESLYNLGNCLIELGDFTGALEQFARLTTLDPQSQRGFLQIGKVRSSPAAGQAFDLALAEEAFREAVALNQEESGALIQLAMVELARGELESAAAHFEGLRVFDARSVHAAFFDGYIRWRRGDAEGARDRLAEAIDFATGAAPTAPASSEGDTDLPGDKALLAEGSVRRTLFGPPLAELEAWTGGPPDAEQTAEVYAALEGYVASLGR